jgi:hypothetical protein
VAASGRHSERLSGRWLLAARVAWVAVAALAVSLFVIAVPAMFEEFTSVCTREAQACGENRLLVSDQMRELEGAGLSAGFYAAYNVALGVVFALACFVAGATIFLRRPDDRMALMVSLMLVGLGSTFLVSPQVVLDAYPALGLPYRFVALAGLALFTLVVYTFPDGRFVPRWAALPALVWILDNVLSIFFSGARLPEWFGVVGFLGFLIPATLAVVVQVYRYRRASDPVQRQQTKWVVFGIAVSFGGYLALVVLQGFTVGFDGTRSHPLTVMLIQTAITALFLGIPLSIGVAVLRSGLWDVDVVINRALVYGSLTLTLALVYLGGVVSLQYAFRALTGSETQLAVVASTLAIAALFVPLRRRVQAFIDRRFYRRKYDAERVLAAFSVTLRDETDLERLTPEVLRVVRETMQPAHASLWLREPERR